jgi:hypothetical protein
MFSITYFHLCKIIQTETLRKYMDILEYYSALFLEFLTTVLHVAAALVMLSHY